MKVNMKLFLIVNVFNRHLSSKMKIARMYSGVNNMYSSKLCEKNNTINVKEELKVFNFKSLILWSSIMLFQGRQL